MKTIFVTLLLLLQTGLIVYNEVEYRKLQQFNAQIKDRLNHDRLKLMTCLTEERK
jgi:hypothetical protein